MTLFERLMEQLNTKYGDIDPRWNEERGAVDIRYARDLARVMVDEGMRVHG